MKTIFLCFVAIAVFTSPTSAQWVKRDGGRLEWIGEMPGTHKECVRDKLLTGQCFYKVWRDMGFKDKMLEDLVKSEKDPSIYTHAVCAEYLWHKPYESYVECRRLLLNARKNSEGNQKIRQSLEKLLEKN